VGLDNGNAVAEAAGATVSIGSIETRTGTALLRATTIQGICNYIEAVQSTNPSPVRTASSAIPTNGDDPVAGCGRISIGADRNGDYASDFYNGKIEAPSIYPTAATHDLPGAQRDSSEFTKGPLAAWVFEIGIDGWSITDIRRRIRRTRDQHADAWCHRPKLRRHRDCVAPCTVSLWSNPLSRRRPVRRRLGSFFLMESTCRPEKRVSTRHMCSADPATTTYRSLFARQQEIPPLKSFSSFLLFPTLRMPTSSW
jgi:hypothetical protein